MDSATLVRNLRAPVHAVFVDDRVAQHDIAVTAIRTSSFGFTRTFVPVSVELELSGWADAARSATLQLRDNGKPMVSQEVPLAGPSRRTIELEFQPLHVGTHVLEAVVVPLPDEATEANNRAWASMRVVRDRTRVLHLAGQPGWDGRFLRTHLRANPAVDLVSFYVMVGSGGGAAAMGDDTTLIPFPAAQLFKESLSSFDLLILQDFPWGPFEMAEYADTIAKYVRGGGALLVLGGPHSLGSGGYAGTPLADLLPLQLQPANAEASWDDREVQPVLTPAGESHPAVLLGRDAAANTGAWSGHRWSGSNRGLQARAGSQVLVGDVSGQPLLAVGELDEGRSAVVATDSLWTWAFGADQSSVRDGEVREAGRGHYHRLLDQLTAWLLRDPDLGLLHLEGPDAAIEAGKDASIRIRTTDGAGQPLAGVRVAWSLQAVSQGQAEPPPLRPWTEASDARGQIHLPITAQPSGAYVVTVEAEIGGRKHRATLPWVVTTPVVEASQLQPSDRLLQLLARTSGGEVWSGAVPARGVPLAAVATLDDSVDDKVHRDIWSRPEVLLLLVGLLSAEWILRRRWGLA
jgi:hypothetical protein